MQKSCTLLIMGLLSAITIQNQTVCLLFGEHQAFVEIWLNKDVTHYKIVTY